MQVISIYFNCSRDMLTSKDSFMFVPPIVLLRTYIKTWKSTLQVNMSNCSHNRLQHCTYTPMFAKSASRLKFSVFYLLLQNMIISYTSTVQAINSTHSCDEIIYKLYFSGTYIAHNYKQCILKYILLLEVSDPNKNNKWRTKQPLKL